MIGTLVLVVGPSGVGKDSLMGSAQATLAQDERFVFPKRHITRPADAGGEAHVALTEEVFQARKSESGYLLHWEAHGFSYGIPMTVTSLLADGKTVVVNTSRTVIGQSEQLIPQTAVIEIKAAQEILRQRLEARGRETEGAINHRLERAAAHTVQARKLFTVDNSGELSVAVRAMVNALQEAANGT